MTMIKMPDAKPVTISILLLFFSASIASCVVMHDIAPNIGNFNACFASSISKYELSINSLKKTKLTPTATPKKIPMIKKSHFGFLGFNGNLAGSIML